MTASTFSLSKLSSSTSFAFTRVGSAAALAAVVVLAGCASGVKLDDKAPVETRAPAPVATDRGNVNPDGNGVASVDLGSRDMTAGLTKTIYFDFDSYVVKDEFRPVVETNAKALTSDKAKKASVQGYTDDRGGREYNLALGQRRAEAVSKSLQLLGVGAGQLEAVSFGSERPAVDGSDDAARAKNRRVELAYK